MREEKASQPLSLTRAKDSEARCPALIARVARSTQCSNRKHRQVAPQAQACPNHDHLRMRLSGSKKEGKRHAPHTSRLSRQGSLPVTRDNLPAAHQASRARLAYAVTLTNADRAITVLRP